MGECKYDWKEIQRYHDAGHTFVECREHFGFSHTAWVKAIQRGDLIARFRSTKRRSTMNDRRRIYDWAEIQRYYDDGHSYVECRKQFGFNPMSWYKARLRGEIVSRAIGMPLSEVLQPNRRRGHVKRRLLHAGLLENKCSACGIVDWLGAPLCMHIDHINGIKNDHRLENLRMLCPNCHSQTPTYSGRNVKRRRGLQDGGAVM